MSNIGALLQLYGAQLALGAPNPEANPDNGLAPPPMLARSPEAPSPAAPEQTAKGRVEKGARQGAATLQAGTDAAMTAGSAALASSGKATAQGEEAAYAQANQDNVLQAALKPEQNAFMGKLDEHDRAFTAAISETQRDVKAAQNRYIMDNNDLKATHVYSWYDNAGTGAKVLGVLSQMLAGGLQGGFGMGGASPLDKIIDSDLAQQKLNAENKRAVASSSANLYQDLLATYKDRVVAEGAFRSIALNSHAERLKAMAAAQGKGQTDATLQKALSDIYAKAADNDQKTMSYMGTMALHGASAKAQVAAHWQGLWNEADKEANKPGKGPGVGVTGIAGSEYLKPEEFREVKKKYDGMKAVQREGTELAKLLDGDVQLGGKSVKVRDIKTGSIGGYQGKLDAQLAKMTFAIKNLEGLGQISGGDEDLVNAAVGLKGGLSAAIKNKVPGMSSYAEVAQRVQAYIQSAQAGLQDSASGYTVGGQQLQYQGEE